MKKIYIIICGEYITGIYLTKQSAKKEFDHQVERMKELYSEKMEVYYYDEDGLFLAHVDVGYTMDVRVILTAKDLQW